MRFSRACGAVLASALAIAPVALSQAARQDVGGLSFRTTTFNNGLGFGARAMGMAGAFTAIADDASAGSWNPAGLGQLIRPEVTVVGGYNQAEIETTRETATFYSTTTGQPRLFLRTADRSVDADSYGVDFGSFVQPFKLGRQLFTTQISYTRNARPLNGTESLRVDFFDPLGRDLAPDLYDTKVSSFGGWDSIGVGLGTGFDEKLYIGFTVNWFTGQTSTSTDTRFRSFFYDATGAQRTFADYRTEAFEEHRYSGLSANVGLLFKPGSKVTIGLVYRGGWSGSDVVDSRFRQAGSYTFNVTSGGTTTAQYLPFSARGEMKGAGTLTWPSTLGGGVSYRPWEALTLAFDASLTQWNRGSVSRVPTPTGGDCALNNGAVTCQVVWVERSLNFPSESFLEQNSQTAYRLGIEYVLRPGSLVLPLRAGAYRIRTIAPIYGVGDTDPDTNFLGFTGGLGFAVPVGEGSFLFDVAAVFDKAETDRDATIRDEAGDVAATQTGARTVRNRRFIGSLIYRF